MFVGSFTFNDLLDFMYHPKLTSSALLIICLTLLVMLSTLFTAKPSRKVFLIDFACYKPRHTLACSKEVFMQKARRYGNYSDETLNFIGKMLERSGMGESTYGAEALMREPPISCMEEARRETEEVMFGAVDELLRKTGVKGKDIGILVVNCSAFNVVPSLSAVIVNRYKLGDNVRSYNLGGMGCTAGLRAIGLAQQLLQVGFLLLCLCRLPFFFLPFLLISLNFLVKKKKNSGTFIYLMSTSPIHVT